jgi:hypothetical protein
LTRGERRRADDCVRQCCAHRGRATHARKQTPRGCTLASALNLNDRLSAQSVNLSVYARSLHESTCD